VNYWRNPGRFLVRGYVVVELSISISAAVSFPFPTTIESSNKKISALWDSSLGSFFAKGQACKLKDFCNSASGGHFCKSGSTLGAPGWVRLHNKKDKGPEIPKMKFPQ
jgi:hypothetical protein